VSAIGAFSRGSDVRATVVAQEASFVGTPRHLHVDVYFSNAVFRFPLHAGLPDPTPDAIITGFNVAGGIGIGPAGLLYVADSVNYRVAVFGPRSDGPGKAPFGCSS
jgi:hypothetical protein